MAAPNPVWGVHVVCGAVTAALVRRTENGSYEILEVVAERAPHDAEGAVRHARTVLSRRGVAARGALVALPDSDGCLATATMSPEELGLSEHELTNEMYEWTHFEPDQAELRHLRVVHEGRRQERLVAALPRAAYARFIEILETGDASRLGVGFAGAATWRGARAMGLMPGDGFLVATLPRVTEVYAWTGGRARRHVLAIGETELTREATAVDVLARDLLQLSDYHRAQRHEGGGPPTDPRFATAGLAASSPAVHQRLAAVLGPRLVAGAVSDAAAVLAPDAKTPALPLAAFAGAVGAAIEALRPLDERLVLRHIPADLPPYEDPRPKAYAAAAASALIVAAVAVGLLNVGRGGPRMLPSRVDAAAKAASRSTAAAPQTKADETAPPADAGPPPAPAAAAALRVEVAGAGRVRVAWERGRDGRTLLRRFLGRDGGGPDEPAAAVQPLDASAGGCVDDVPGPTGLYAWSLDGRDEVRAFVEVRVEVELLGPGDAGGARFALRRPWRDGTATLPIDVPPGGRLAGADATLAFDSGLRLDAVRTRVESERAVARVPRFQRDGRVERAADGSTVTRERVVERERRIFEVDAAAPDGSRRTWSRKMTDG